MLHQAQAKVEWRVLGSTTINTITVTGQESSITIPENTLPEGEIEWRVTVKSDDNVWSSPSQWYKLTTVDTLSTAKALLPKDEYLDGSTENLFTWEHATSTGSQQYAFDLQVNTGSGWTDLVSHKISSQQRYSVPPGSLPTGPIKWRVRTYNTEDIPGAWSSENEVYVIGAPRAANITAIKSGAKPTVFWESDGQQLWQLQVFKGESTVFDTGNMPGITVRSYIIPTYLDDGEYTVRLRIRNEYDFWSQWTTSELNISTIKPPKPRLGVISNCDYGIRLNISLLGCLIYRREAGSEWLNIGRASEVSFTDYTAASGVVYEYMARNINENNSFSDSGIESGRVNLRYTILSKGSDLLELKMRLDTGIHRNYTFSREKILSHFTGRSLPAVERGGTKTKSVGLNYFIPADKLDIILRLADEAVILYRSPTGEKFYGTIGELVYEERFTGPFKGYEVTFDIRAVDFGEGEKW